MHSMVAVVTGGTGALGRVVVRRFLAGGVRVAIPTSPHHDAGRSAELFPTDHPFLARADLRSDAEVSAFVSRVKEEFGAIQYLVNIAGGYAGGKAIEEIAVETWDDMLETNLKTAFLMTRAVLPLMRVQKLGRIVNIAAMHAVLPSAGRAAYAVSKRGVVTLTESTHEEIRGSGITVNAIAPGTIATEQNRKSMPGADVSKWVSPEEIAELIWYLCSEQARSISGNTIRVFGAA
jgi:NAD(P)-dependent dehydrogenase (short-subunit alcohol dehydrogenase family)